MPQVLCPVLVGRDEEARLLRAALAAAGAGRGGTVFLTGEAGIGKSRLVRETVRAAAELGLTVLAGRAVAGGVPTPFRPFAEALTSAGRAGRLPASAELDPFRPVLGRLVPEWRPPQGPPAEESPVFLGEAVLRLLRVLSPQAGCVLVLEDLHWADRETLALLEYLADNLAAERVLCVAHPPGRRRRRRGPGQRAGRARIRRRAAAGPAGSGGDGADGPGLPGRRRPAGRGARRRRRAGRGHPVPGRGGPGRPGRGGGADRAGRPLAAPPTWSLPGSRPRSPTRSGGGWTAWARTPGSVIGAAAVLGRRFDWALLSPVTGLAGAAVVAALRDGVGLQLIVAERESFRFRHALTHEAVLAGLLPPERALLAGRALAAVEAAHPGLPGAWCTLAADLAGRAGDAARAGALLLEAGRRDLAVGALASAEHTLARARAADRPRPAEPASMRR